MGDNGSSGIVGLLGLVFFAALFFLSRRLFPGFSKIILILGVIAVLLIVIFAAIVLYFAFNGTEKKPKKEQNTQGAKGAQEQIDEIYANGRRTLVDLRMRATRVKNRQVRSLCEEICASADKILKTTKEHPENLGAVRQFLNYYLPTMGSILIKYVRLEESDIPTEEISEKTIHHLSDINIAMQKQYENLFAGDILDLSVEMEALTQACKRDGLLSDDLFKDGDKGIKLTI